MIREIYMNAGEDPYANLTTDTIISAALVESEIKTLEWILGIKYSKCIWNSFLNYMQSEVPIT